MERVRGTIAGTSVDHLAAQPVLMMFAARHAGYRYIDYTRDGIRMAEAQLKVAEDFGVDCLLTCSDPAREVIDIAGEGSVDWLVDQGPAIDESRAVLLDKTVLRSLAVPDPLGGGRMHDRIKGIEHMRCRAGAGVSIVGWVEGPLALSQELRGLNRIMTDFYDDPVFVKDVLAFSADVAIRYAAAQIDAGADTIGLSDAAASMMGPEFYVEFLWPQQKRVMDSIKALSPSTIIRLHMCGKTDPLVPMMGKLPADIIELDFPVDLAGARSALGPDRVICGNVSTITDLLEGTPDKVYEACRRCHEVCGRYHIAGAGCEVSPMTPPDNLKAMFAYAADNRP